MLGSRRLRSVSLLRLVVVALALAGALWPAPARAVPEQVCTYSAVAPRDCVFPVGAGRYSVELTNIEGMQAHWRIDVWSVSPPGQAGFLECWYDLLGETRCRAGERIYPADGDDIESAEVAGTPVVDDGRLVFTLAVGGRVEAALDGDVLAGTFHLTRL